MVKAATLASYSNTLRLHILPAFGATKVRHLQRGRLKAWLARTEHRSLPAEKTLPDSKVTAIPEGVIQRYKLDTTFYKKHLDYKGFSILSSAKVSDVALLEARYLIDKLLGKFQHCFVVLQFFQEVELG